MFSSRKTAIIFLFVVGFLIYSANFSNSLFWDDDDWIKNNPFVHNFSHLKEIFTQNVLAGFGLNSNYYRPLLLLSFAINYSLHGAFPFGYHLFSNLLHIGAGILVYLLLERALGRKLVSFLAALIFIIHPLQTEAVTYISGRGDPLSVFLMLLGLYFWALAHNKSRPRTNILIGAYVSSVAALMARETAILFPVLVMIYDVAFLQSGSFLKSIWHSFKKTWPFFAITATYFLLRLTILNFENTLNFYSETNDYTENLWYRLFTFGAVLIEYIKLIFAPVGLHMERDAAIRTSLFNWPVWLSGLGLLTLLGSIILQYRKNNQSLEYKVWFFSSLWFFVGLLPVSGILPINAVMYEHWLYLPIIGVATLAGFYLDRFFGYLRPRKFLFRLAIILLAAYFSFFGAASIKRNIAWGNPIAFYEDILKYNPNTTRVINNLAILYSEKGDLARAETLYLQAISLPRGNKFAQPYYNLGNIYRDRGEIKKAIEFYQKAIEVDPNFPFAYQNLAVIYAAQGNLFEAASMLEKVKSIKPHDPEIYFNLGLIYGALGQKELARQHLIQAQQISSDPAVDREVDRALKSLK